ncbi:inner nuclear membrane protein enriched at telomere/subtelomere region [Podila horticola]|nr:inner nuclear membrane protein enriched at telomere/subtelomere region [Podila horticola]
MPPQELPKYLRPDFDPWSIKMDLIRDILIQHDIKPPTGAVRKQELVDMFNLHIKPQVAKLREAHQSVVPTEEGIIKVPKGKGTIMELYDGDNDDSDSLPPRSAKATRSKSFQPVVEVPPVAKVKRSNSRVMAEKSDTESKDTRGRKPRKSGFESDTDDTARSASRSRKKSVDKMKAKKSDNFSNENPFQSGNDTERTRSKSRDTSSRTRSSSRSRSKKTVKEPARAPEFKVPEQPAFSRFMQTPTGHSEKSSGSSPYQSSPSLRTRSKKVEVDLPKPKTLHISAEDDDNILDKDWGLYFRLIGCTLAAIGLAYGVWYRNTRFEIGFCPASDQGANQSGNWLYPSCIPCPDHALCLTPDSEPICSPEYLLKPHILSFGNLLPLSPICVLDRAKEYQSFQIADAAEKWVHEQAGKEECSFYRVSPKVRLARQQIPEEELRKHVEQAKEAKVSDEEFQEYWEMALRELHRRSDKVVFEANEDGKTIRSLKPRKTISCRLRQALVGWIVKFKAIFTGIVLSAIALVVLQHKVAKRQKKQKIINGLVANVLSKLSTQAHYYYVDPVLHPDPFLPQLHLRDALLANVHSPTERQEIWAQVEKIVEKNSNVRLGSQEVRGEPHRTWEWVGASGVLEDRSYDTVGDNVVRGSSSSYARGVPAVPTRTGPHGSFFGMRRQDSEFMNPLNPMYPSLSQEYDSYERD